MAWYSDEVDNINNNFPSWHHESHQRTVQTALKCCSYCTETAQACHVFLAKAPRYHAELRHHHNLIISYVWKLDTWTITSNSHDVTIDTIATSSFHMSEIGYLNHNKQQPWCDNWHDWLCVHCTFSASNPMLAANFYMTVHARCLFTKLGQLAQCDQPYVNLCNSNAKPRWVRLALPKLPWFSIDFAILRMTKLCLLLGVGHAKSITFFEFENTSVGFTDFAPKAPK